MPSDSSFKPIEILLVEDSSTDAIITQEALKEAQFINTINEAQFINTINIVEDGVEALAYLRRQGQYHSTRRPDLIMLDLNLPRKNGREVLAEIKTDPDLKRIPVVVLTTSQAEQDILQAYGLHANCYVIKPVEFDNFVRAVQSIRQFWFSIVTLPSEVDHAA